MRGRTRLAGPRCRRGRRLGASRKAEAMHFADHRIARDAAELACDLARRQAVRPQLLEKLDPFVGPTHVLPLAGEIHRFRLLASIVRPTKPERNPSTSPDAPMAARIYKTPNNEELRDVRRTRCRV